MSCSQTGCREESELEELQEEWPSPPGDLHPQWTVLMTQGVAWPLARAGRQVSTLSLHPLPVPARTASAC